ncbi:TIGR04222 domain-containing membrane protein [Streptomyces sp. TR02-1]|uniref:TIGR04222 domain-containing membrane protein n=1 Tax=Streptomyces sp. TR02-1 TaxID=3385977 RepID=UPI0039A0E20D
MWVLFVLVAWGAAALSCARLCAAAATAWRAPRGTGRPPAPSALSLYETAFLSGGPPRLADVALVAMSEERRILLAHTGWATVVDPRGRDAMERSVLEAIGPGGQSPVPPIRTALGSADAVAALGDRLAAAGLAVPEALRAGLTSATRQVRGAAVLVAATGLTAELLEGFGDGSAGRAPWFALPLVLTLGALAIARWELRPEERRASPAGERLLHAADGDGGRTVLTDLARHGTRTLPKELRTALGGGRPPLRGVRG